MIQGSGIGGQKDSSQYTVDNSQGKANASRITHHALRSLKGQVDTTRLQGAAKTASGAEKNKELKKAVKDIEALFAYQLIKVMRETSGSTSSEQKGLGGDTYMSLFDMEVSKLFADRGLGLQEPLMRWLERSKNITDNNIDNEKNTMLKIDRESADKIVDKGVAQ